MRTIEEHIKGLTEFSRNSKIDLSELEISEQQTFSMKYKDSSVSITDRGNGCYLSMYLGGMYESRIDVRVDKIEEVVAEMYIKLKERVDVFGEGVVSPKVVIEKLNQLKENALSVIIMDGDGVAWEIKNIYLDKKAIVISAE